MKEEKLIDTAINKLPRDWQAEFIASTSGPYDGQLALHINNQHITLVVECKRVHRKESLKFLIENPDRQRLLICEQMSDFLREYCEEHQINYLDSAGNLRIAHDNFYALVEGREQESTRSVPESMSIGIAKCLFAFIAEEGLLNKNYQEIADKAAISLGMVTKSMQYLIRHNYIPADKKKRRFLNIEELQYQWLMAYRTTVRPKLNSVPLPPPAEWQAVPIENGELWGGEAAAAQLTEYLIPQDLVLFSHTMTRGRKYPLGQKGQSPLKLTKAFWGEKLAVSQTGVALLAIGELLATNDGRNRETAEIINDKYLQLKQLP
ncbi:hypothetical protein L3Q72_05240 [Vibrio sp. JC009]|uniref:type IV toxin-antitoxin system AbiEi family antitoxin n=1 Tax=Vibrio sp. JC009 TaxID=2912314 RepID=UPI0023B0CD82|nr:type IV toxin-antitoxin system AbiEi family antitoxin [Vibrio sp. JC009]WED22797.1 hypothetical protein L3Q72_05240 [Vibrio sp. JC009]